MQTCTGAKKQRAELKSRSQVAGLGWSYLYEPDHPRPPRYVSTAESTAAINQNALCGGEIFRTAAETKKEEREAAGGSYIITDGWPEALSSKNLKRNRQTNTTV